MGRRHDLRPPCPLIPLKKLRAPMVATKWVENQMLGGGRKLSR